MLRDRDEVGFSFVVDGISSLHRRYVKSGSYGFMLGDGRLSYGPEVVGDLRDGDSEWLTACQDEAKKLSEEASTLGCGKAFDDCCDCADKSVHCQWRNR